MPARPRRSRPTSLGQRSPVRLGDHVRRVPLGPVGVLLAGTGLVLTMSRGRPLQGADEVVDRDVLARAALDAPGKAGRDLLEEEGVAVGVPKSGERPVAGSLARAPVRPTAVDVTELRAGSARVEHLTDLGTSG